MLRALCYNECMNDIINGIKGRLVKDNSPISIPFNSKQMQLALDRNPDSINKSWNMACLIAISNGFIDPRGAVNIDHIVINGVDRVFH